MQNISHLESIRIVLNETTHPGNIGGAARALKNMGFSQLCLVAPRQFPHPDATARASGANDVLANVQVFSNLEEAIAPCGFVVGTSARERSLPGQLMTPRQVCPQILTEARGHPVAIVFGGEQSGLSNEDLAKCHVHIRIPCNEAFSSLNLAAAVQVVCYELRTAALEHPQYTNEPLEPLASAEEMQNFYQHLEKTLSELEFFNPQGAHALMLRLKRFFNRARPEYNELNILHGILSAAQKGRVKQ